MKKGTARKRQQSEERPEENLGAAWRSEGQREVVRLGLTLVPPGRGLNLGGAGGQGLEGGGMYIIRWRYVPAPVASVICSAPSKNHLLSRG